MVHGRPTSIKHDQVKIQKHNAFEVGWFMRRWKLYQRVKGYLITAFSYNF